MGGICHLRSPLSIHATPYSKSHLRHRLKRSNIFRSYATTMFITYPSLSEPHVTLLILLDRHPLKNDQNVSHHHNL